MTPPRASTLALVVRRTVRANAERVFAAWTEPDQLRQWWGPKGVICTHAEVDLRVGGRYRIGNAMPDGRVLWIAGEFERIAPPHELVYTWRIEPEDAAPERVTVRFEARGGATEIVLVHERIADATTRDRHEAGWYGCFNDLAEYLSKG